MRFKPVKCEKCGFYKTEKNRFVHKKKCKGIKLKQPIRAVKSEKERLSRYEARYQIGSLFDEY